MSRFSILDLFAPTAARKLRKTRRSIAKPTRKLFLEGLEGRVLLATDLVLTKTDNVDPVAPGGNITYSITVTNSGPDDATNLTVLDLVPANTTFAAITAPAGWVANTPAVGATGPVIVTTPLLANGASATIQLTVQVNAGTPLDTLINNSAVVSSSVQDTNAANNSDAETTLVQVSANADLQVTKADSPDPVVAGTNVTYTITVSNVGSADAANVEFSDVVPTGTTFVSLVQDTGPTFVLNLPAVGGTGTATGTIGTLAAGASATFTAVVNVPASVADGTTISNTTTAVTTSVDANALNNTDTETTTVSAQADLVVTKTETPDPVVAGSNLTYNITVTNSGSSDAQNVVVSDLLPDGTTFVSLAQNSGPAFVLNPLAVGGTGTVTANIATLAAGASATFSLVVNVAADVLQGATITNTATAATTTVDVNAANNADVEVSDVLAQADLTVAKVESPDPVIAGGNITYTVNITNNGGSDAQAVALTDVVPTNTTFVSLSAPAGWTTVTPAVGGTGTVTATIPTLAAGASASFTLIVQVDAGATGSISNTALIASATTEINAADNSDTETTTIQAATGAEVDLSVTKVETPDPIVAGTDLTYSITVQNLSSTNAAANVVLSDAIPTGATFVSFAAPAGWTSTTPAVGGTGTVTTSIPTLAAGASATFTLVVNAAASLAAGATLSNTATVSTTNVDTNLDNNTDIETTLVDAQSDLSVTKSDAPDPVAAGGNITYTVTVTNNGPSDALNVLLSDAVPASTTFVSLSSPAGWTPTVPAVGGTGPVTATIPTLAVGASATFMFVVAVDSAATGGAIISNTVSIDTTTTDANAANDTDTETTVVASAASADLSVTKSDSPEPVVAGGNLTYTIVVSNSGPSAATSVVLTEAVPTGATFVSLTSPAGWTATTPAVGGTGPVTATIPTLASGASATFTLVVAVNALATGTISNTATVSSATADANLANNSELEITTIQVVAGTSDFGDAPDSYGTLLASGGAQHTLGSGLVLGAAADADADGQPTADALGDDTDLDGDDEDGVLLAGLVAGACTTTTVTVSGDGFLDAWIDFDGSGTFDEDERIAEGLFVTAGDNALDFSTPVDAVGGTTYARFRISSTGGLSPTGPAADGEVEDYQLEIIEIAAGSAGLVDDPNNPGARMLVVVGTNKNDHILIEPRPTDRTQIRVKSGGKLMGIFDSSEISRIVGLGLGGNDVIIVNAKIAIAAELCGGSGNDKLFGGSGDDQLWGEDGNDYLYGGKGNDTLLGGVGNDFAFGGHGNDLLLGEAGNDKLYGEAGNDSLLAGTGNDFLYGGSGNDQLLGEEGNDKLYGDAGHDLLLGGLGCDVMHGGSGRDLVIGGEGRDKVYGDGDDDILIGGTTDFDADEAALLDILAEWSSSASFSARIANLEATLNDGTVFDDGEIDDLSGGGGRDWYLDFGANDKRLGFASKGKFADQRN